MSISRDRFEQGLTYEAWKSQMTRNRERFDQNERGLELSAGDLAPFRDLGRSLKVLVLAEDWCGDVIANLPILGRIAQEAGTLDIRVFLRDENDDLMAQYLNQGQFKSIPVFAFFDSAFREVGVFIERPSSVTRLRAKKRAEIDARLGIPPGAAPAELPDDKRQRLLDELAEMREETKAFADREVVRELREMIARLGAIV